MNYSGVNRLLVNQLQRHWAVNRSVRKPLRDVITRAESVGFGAQAERRRTGLLT